MDRARMSAIMNAEELEVTVKRRYWCIFPIELSFVFISEFFQAKWYSSNQFSFIYFLISWTTSSICGISQIKNAMIPITKIPVMTVARVSFVINYFQTWFEKSFRYRLLLITSLLNQWINPAPVKLDLDSNQADLKKFNWAEITIWKVFKFFEDGESRWFLEISGLHVHRGSLTKKFLLIESPRNQNRIEYKKMKQFWFGWWKMKVNKSNWRYGKIGCSMNSCFQQERISERFWLKKEWVLIQL